MKITINLHRALDPVYVMQHDAEARCAAGAAWLERWQRLVPVTPPAPGPSAREIIATGRSRLDAVHSVQELVRTDPHPSLRSG